MAKFQVQFVRIEHNVHTFYIEADSEDDVRDLADEYVNSDEFDWDDYETVHADEYINDIQEMGK